MTVEKFAACRCGAKGDDVVVEDLDGSVVTEGTGKEYLCRLRCLECGYTLVTRFDTRVKYWRHHHEGAVV